MNKLKNLKKIPRMILNLLKSVVVLRVYQVLVVVTLLGTFGYWVIDAFQISIERDLEHSNKVAALADYETDLNVYVIADFQYQNCLTNIELREGLVASANNTDKFISILVSASDDPEAENHPAVAELRQLVTDELERIDESGLPEKEEDCLPKPVKPVRPAILSPSDVKTIDDNY